MATEPDYETRWNDREEQRAQTVEQMESRYEDQLFGRDA